MGCDDSIISQNCVFLISIHASRMGCDARISQWRDWQIFQSTHPVWDATGSLRNLANYAYKFQSTHPVWDATRDHAAIPGITDISIHASRMGCDMWHNQLTFNQRISIHASRMGCDTRIRNSRSVPGYFNPRIPYGMRPTCNTWTH